VTLEECRAHIGRRVAYRAGSRLAAKGAITSVGTRPYVRYDGDKLSTVAYPEELTLLEVTGE
jgi:hypothetical protein